MQDGLLWVKVDKLFLLNGNFLIFKKIISLNSPTITKKPSIIASPHLGISVPATNAKPKVSTPTSPAPLGTSKPVVSPAFVTWFFTALERIPPSSGVNGILYFL